MDQMEILAESSSIQVVLQCKICEASNVDISFTSKETLKKHMKEDHQEVNKVPCNYCGIVYSSKSNMAAHIRTVHRDKLHYTCVKCLKMFETEKGLQTHLRHCHKSSDRRVRCRFCGQTCIGRTHEKLCKYRLSRVESSDCSVKQKSFICQYCGVEYSLKSSLSRHMRSNHGQVLNHVCQYCSQSFETDTGLEMHINMSHGNLL